MSTKRNAFTLIELLVVISIIALLVAILMPALNKAREQATGAVCLGNHKALIMAFLMYCGDNEDSFCSGYVNLDVLKRDPPTWVMAPLAYANDGSLLYQQYPTELEFRKNGIREGALYEYINTTDVYNCPGDRRWLKGTSNGKPPEYGVFRSYALPDYYRVNDLAIKETKITNIKPASEKYVFLEDNYDGPWSIDAWSYFVGERKYWDPIGNYHNVAATFSFADGHGEMHKWEDPRTWIFCNSRAEASAQGCGKGHVQVNPLNPDHDWLDRHYPGKTRYPGGVP